MMGGKGCSDLCSVLVLINHTFDLLPVATSLTAVWEIWFWIEHSPAKVRYEMSTLVNQILTDDLVL